MGGGGAALPLQAQAVGTSGGHSAVLSPVVTTLLHNGEALGPVEWVAPEVCASTAAGTIATFASDVYMLGGVLYELLTGGTRPFSWLVDSTPAAWLLSTRRGTSGRVPVPGVPGVFVAGLHGVSVVEAAAADGFSIPWCVRHDGSPESLGREKEARYVRMHVHSLSDTVAPVQGLPVLWILSPPPPPPPPPPPLPPPL